MLARLGRVAKSRALGIRTALPNLKISPRPLSRVFSSSSSSSAGCAPRALLFYTYTRASSFCLGVRGSGGGGVASKDATIREGGGRISGAAAGCCIARGSVYAQRALAPGSPLAKRASDVLRLLLLLSSFSPSCRSFPSSFRRLLYIDIFIHVTSRLSSERRLSGISDDYRSPLKAPNCRGSRAFFSGSDLSLSLSRAS